MMSLVATPLKRHVPLPLQPEQGKPRQEAGDIAYDEEVVKILRAASEAEPIIPPQDTEAFFKFLHQTA